MTQKPISHFFKSVSSLPLQMNSKENKRRNRHNAELMTSTTFMKRNLVIDEDHHSNVTIDLLSDSEEDSPSGSLENLEALRNVECVLTESLGFSPDTIIYGTPKTPTKTQRTPSTVSNSPHSSSSKYYSPVKKRMLKKRSPVKRKLEDSFIHNSQNYLDDEKDQDDKTNFLRQTINKCLQTYELRVLLDQKSQELLSKNVELCNSGMKLVCRLFWRKHCWYGSKQLAAILKKDKQKEGQSNIQDVLAKLLSYGFITATGGKQCLNFDECASLLNSEQCKKLCKSLLLKCYGTTKEAAIKALSNFSVRKPISRYFKTNNPTAQVNNAERVLKLMQDKVGTCYKLSESANEALNKLYMLMYLGMNYAIIREKKLEYTLINYKIKAETYPIDKEMTLDNASVVFKTVTEFERYFEAHNIYENYLIETDVKKKLGIIRNVYEKYIAIPEQEMKCYKVLPVWLRRFTPAYLYIKMIEKGIDDLKREEEYHLALEMLSILITQSAFRQHKKGDWYAEKSLILHRYIREFDEAGKILLKGLKCPDLPIELKQCLLRRAEQLVNQKNIRLHENVKEKLVSVLDKELLIKESDFNADYIYKQHMEFEGRGRKKFKTRTDEGWATSVAEDYCISYYIQNGQFTNGSHCEGSTVTTMFTLLFWDIIYMQLKGFVGIFLTLFQLYPMDMHFPSFYENRKVIIDERLAWIEGSDAAELREAMRKVWDSRPEGEMSGINRGVGWESVCEVCECLGPRQVAALCRRLATAHGYARSGFPDLTLWNTNTKRIKFVEVKTDTDKPSIKQLQWMHYLQSVGIDTGFCYVGVKTRPNQENSESETAFH